MNQYEVTFIVDPVLSGDEINATAQSYVDHLQAEKCKIVHVDEMGLKQLAYPINRKTTGVYYCVEFTCESGVVIEKLELAFRRDERIMRFLSVRLDKYGVKYNEDKRNGLIGKVQEKKKKVAKEVRKEVKREKKEAKKEVKQEVKQEQKEVKKDLKQEPAQAKAATVATETATAEEE